MIFDLLLYVGWIFVILMAFYKTITKGSRASDLGALLSCVYRKGLNIMVSTQPLSYKQAFALFAEGGPNVREHEGDKMIIQDWRRHTHLVGKWSADMTVFIIDVVLYDSPIATLFPDHVQLHSAGWKTPTTKNRMNDVLRPLGWILKSIEGEWKVMPIPADSKVTGKDYHDDMIVRELYKEARDD